MHQFSDVQLQYMATVLNNMGTVTFAAMVIPRLTGQNFNPYTMALGLLYSFLCWWYGFMLISGTKKECL